MKTWLPFFAWLLWLPAAGPEMLQSHWECAIVVFAAAVLVPEGLSLLGISAGPLYWVSVSALGLAYLFPEMPVLWRGILALPYVVLSLWVTLRELSHLLVLPKIQMTDMVRVAALAYWATGAVWALCFLTGYRPFDFDLVIVSLTAAHFHVAGFVLSTVVYRMLATAPGSLTTLAGWGALTGMPSVALGITLTRLGYSSVMEWMSALLFALFAGVVLVWHITRFKNPAYPLVARRYWLSGAICLLVGAVFAALYALRFLVPIDGINIPNMKIWHGTLNAIGFGWLTLRGWSRVP